MAVSMLDPFSPTALLFSSLLCRRGPGNGKWKWKWKMGGRCFFGLWHLVELATRLGLVLWPVQAGVEKRMGHVHLTHPHAEPLRSMLTFTSTLDTDDPGDGGYLHHFTSEEDKIKARYITTYFRATGAIFKSAEPPAASATSLNVTIACPTSKSRNRQKSSPTMPSCPRS
jgi:hypothetical protein